MGLVSVHLRVDFMEDVLRMRIERYYYTEYKEEAEPRIKEMQEHLLLQQEAIRELPEEEQMEHHEAQKESANEYLSEIMPLPSEICTIINPAKHRRFAELAEESISLAKELGANLLAYTENTTGCITFVGEELGYIEKHKAMLEKLTATADEVHIALSVDTGEGSPTDIDGLVRMEFWFDFYVGII